MNSIDQYYEIARRELREIAEVADAHASAMTGKLGLDPENRPLPSVSDMRMKLATVERMIARFTLMCELGASDVPTAREALKRS